MKTEIIKLKGMDCKNCATSIKMYLSTLEGISKVDVSYDKKEAVVDYDSAKVNPNKIKEAIRELGFKA